MTENERKNTIEALKRIQKDYIHIRPTYEWNGLARAIHELETNRWISVDEKLPNHDKRTQNLSEEVQVTVKDEFETVVDVAYYDYAEKKWHIELFDDGEVLAWKPLPQPYKNDLCDIKPFDSDKFKDKNAK